MKILRIVSIFVIILLVSGGIIPGVFAWEATKGMDTGIAVGEVADLDNPVLTIKENTWTSTIFEFGKFLVILKSNSGHTRATMSIENTLTHEIESADYIVTDESGVYTTKVYQKDTLIRTFYTTYDPLKPNFESQIGDPYIPGVNKSYELYSWDGVTYTLKGYGIKYSHPDYDTYKLNPWDNKYIKGNSLNHYHIPDYLSKAIGLLPPLAAGAAIVAILVSGAAFPPLAAAETVFSGALLGALTNVATSAVILDEKGSIWVLLAREQKTLFLPLPPPNLPIWVTVPRYTTVAEYNLWDDLGIGLP